MSFVLEHWRTLLASALTGCALVLGCEHYWSWAAFVAAIALMRAAGWVLARVIERLAAVRRRMADLAQLCAAAEALRAAAEVAPVTRSNRPRAHGNFPGGARPISVSR